MVGYITIAHGIAQRLSEKWRHFACTSAVITFCTSPFCVGVRAAAASSLTQGGSVLASAARRRTQRRPPLVPPRATRRPTGGPLVLSAHAYCFWLLRQTATASPPACLAGVATRRHRALNYTRARRAASSAFDVPRPPHVAGHGGAPSPALARRRPSAPPSRVDAPPARVLPLEGIVTPTGGLSSIIVAALSLFHPRTAATVGAHAHARRETRRSAMLIERSSRSDRSRALSRPRRRGPRGSPAHGTAASSLRAL